MDFHSIAESLLPDDPSIRQLHSPVTAAQLRPLGPRCEYVQFSTPLTEDDFTKVAAFLKKYPEVCLRVYAQGASDLEFLRFFPFVRRLRIDVYDLRDLHGISYASTELADLHLGATKPRRHSLQFLARFPKLFTLFIEGHGKDIDTIGSLANLHELTLRSITLPDLKVLRPLRPLVSLAIELGGTNNLELLPNIGSLRYLKLFRVRGLANLKPIERLSDLRCLFLQDLTNVARLPSFSALSRLRCVHLDTLKSLADLRPIAEAPALKELIACGMRHLTPESFRPFIRHPTLRRALIGLGSVRKNKAVSEMLGLPEVDPQTLEATLHAGGTARRMAT